MKSFFKTFFASFFALVLFFGCLFVFGTLALIGFASSASLRPKTAVKVDKGSYLVFDLSANLTDTPAPTEQQQSFGRLFGNEDKHALSLRRTIDGLGAAATDDRIAGIFIRGSFQAAGYGSGYAALKEVREALIKFKESKKPVFAFLVEPGPREYYLASVADDIYLHPYGALDIPGLASQPMFFASALERLGVGVQVTRVGKYKSAVEPFIRNDLSPESREQTQALLNDVWKEWTVAVQDARKISAADLQSLIDEHPVMEPDLALSKNLVTKKGYLSDAIDELRKRTGRDDEDRNTFRQVALGPYAESKAPGEPIRKGGKMSDDTTPKIAIVYAEGEIIDGNSTAEGSVAGGRFARELRRLRQDDSVKAIVLRVNSPGGSALASEEILREAALARDGGKPVIVSMGTVAASGGYWISTAAERVFAEPNTITGSIGVFGILPNIQKLANDHGVTFDTVSTAKHADLMTVSRPKNPEELAIIQGVVDHIYDEFLGKVAAARKLPKERVAEIAQGRVWSGAQAKELGLVDEIGGLQAALGYAKKKAGLADDAKVAEYPQPKDFGEQLTEVFSGERRPMSFLSRLGLGNGNGIRAHAGPAGREFGQIVETLDGALQRLNDPAHAYARLPFDLMMN